MKPGNPPRFQKGVLARSGLALAAAFLAGAGAFAQTAPAGGPVPGQQDKIAAAVLGGLDKVTARVSTMSAPINRPVRLGALEIIVRACHKRLPEEPPETLAFLEISEIRPAGPSLKLFTGWMFASSPALNALEHPVYDVWVMDCKTDAPESSAGKP